jgi:glycosyltransferase involved in cell wall biosynthesis
MLDPSLPRKPPWARAMRRLRRPTEAAAEPARSREFDVAFYMPWIGPLLAPGTGPPPGGAETQMLMLARALVQRGRRVCIVACGSRDSLPYSIDGIAVFAQRPVRARARAIRIVLWALFAMWSLGRLKARVFVQRAAGPTTGIVGLIARAKGSDFVYSSANVIDFAFERLERSPSRVLLFNLGVKLASTIVVQTHEQVDMCRRRFGRDPTLIKSIAEPARATEICPQAFVWVGRAAPYKRPEAFVDLALAVPEARFRMILVAANEQNHDLPRKVAERCQNVRNIELIDPLPRAELLRLIESAVAMVNTADYEGMPNVFLESWARGVPALSLVHDPDGVIDRESLGFFAEGSPERFAAQARQLWRTRHNQSELRERCRDYVTREHAPDRVVDRWMEALGLHRS